MGRRNKAFSRTLKQQIYDKFTSMLNSGEGTSKKESMLNGTDSEKIFSYSTYKTYYKHCKYFANYIKENHPECTTLRSAKKYVNEWLQSRVEQTDKNGNHLSAWTITLERQALGKLYGIKPDDPNFFQAPKRHRKDIIRSRSAVKRDVNFSEKNNDEFVKFCRGTGCRRNILKKLEGRDFITKEEILVEIERLEKETSLSTDDTKRLSVLQDTMTNFPDQNYFLHHRNDKGGRERFSPVIGNYADKIVQRMKETEPNEKVWYAVPDNADIHGYRSDYATSIYKLYARPIEEIPFDKINRGSGRKYQSGVYTCRKDEAGKKLDKEAMLRVSKALGHNRLELVANNYIRGL